MTPVWDDAGARDLLRRLFDAAVASADPRQVLARHLPEPPTGRCVVVGAGKSAAAMAAALEQVWSGVELSGAVVTRYGHGCPTRRIEVIEAAHPVPDANSERAARRMLELVGGLTPDDLVLALISGGGSSLLALPAAGLTLADKQAVARSLLVSGATIHEMNAVRKHLSAIKGGRLGLAAAPARLVTLAISDVPGDDPAVIASGPTVPDPSTCDEVAALIEQFHIDLPEAVAHYLRRREETPKPGSFPVDYRLIATPAMALREAVAVASTRGVTPVILGDALEGESRELGIAMAGIAKSVRRHGYPQPPPALLLSGGETTVSIGRAAKPGRGGRNTEFLLGLALALSGEQRIWALAGDTDGIDGTDDAAGALVTPDTLHRARQAGLDPRALLTSHDSYSLFSAIGDLVRTGPTLTNVNDFRAILIAA